MRRYESFLAGKNVRLSPVKVYCRNSFATSEVLLMTLGDSKTISLPVFFLGEVIKKNFFDLWVEAVTLKKGGRMKGKGEFGKVEILWNRLIFVSVRKIGLYAAVVFGEHRRLNLSQTLILGSSMFDTDI